MARPRQHGCGPQRLRVPFFNNTTGWRLSGDLGRPVVSLSIVGFQLHACMHIA